MIFENEFFVTGTGGKMTEGIFVSNCNDVIIDGNDITATCDGPAYGIGTNYLFNAAIAALMASTFSSSVLLSRSPISSDPAISSSALSSFVSWSFIA